MENFDEKLNELIKKDLPAQVGETLRGVLEQGKIDAGLVLSQAETIKRKDDEIQRLNKRITGFETQEREFNKLNSREDELNKRENKLKIDELQFQLTAEREKTQFTKDVAMGLVRNAEYRKNVWSNDNVDTGEKDQYGCNRIEHHDKNGGETTTQE